MGQWYGEMLVVIAQMRYEKALFKHAVPRIAARQDGFAR